IVAAEANEGNGVPLATPLEERSSSGPNGPPRGYAAGPKGLLPREYISLQKSSTNSLSSAI
ncbi:MAG: hypothetical protein LBJ81_00190, partial [Puniceicoccales bacterium]|nr:hypothetical protein [Puniceicoccales bacterium]